MRGFPMVPLVGNICTNLITNDTIGNEIGANGKNGNTIETKWYKCYQPMVPLGEPQTHALSESSGSAGTAGEFVGLAIGP